MKKHTDKITFKAFYASCKQSSCVHPTLIRGKKKYLFGSKVNTIQYIKSDLLQNLFANLVALTTYCHNDNLSTVAQDCSYISWKQLQQTDSL